MQRQQFKKICDIKLIALLAILTICGSIQASEECDSKFNTRNSLSRGSWSLAFGIDRNFSLVPFGGNMVLAKLHFSDRSALRAGFGLDYKYDSNKRGPSRWKKDISSSMVIQYIYYPITNRKINLFIGIGPRLAIIGRLSDSGWDIKYNYGAQSNWGVEYFFSRHVSLFCEYGAVLIYAYDYIQQGTKPGLNRPIGHYLGLYPTPVTMGLSVYF